MTLLVLLLAAIVAAGTVAALALALGAPHAGPRRAAGAARKAGAAIGRRSSARRALAAGWTRRSRPVWR